MQKTIFWFHYIPTKVGFTHCSMCESHFLLSIHQKADELGRDWMNLFTAHEGFYGTVEVGCFACLWDQKYTMLTWMLWVIGEVSYLFPKMNVEPWSLKYSTKWHGKYFSRPPLFGSTLHAWILVGMHFAIFFLACASGLFVYVQFPSMDMIYPSSHNHGSVKNWFSSIVERPFKYYAIFHWTMEKECSQTSINMWAMKKSLVV